MLAPKVIRINGTVYHRADTIANANAAAAEAVKTVLSASGITVEQICALADQLKTLCAEESAADAQES